MSLRARLLLAQPAELRVNDVDDVTWAHVVTNGRLRAFWSHPLASDEQVHAFAVGLSARIRATEIHDAIEWWPEGWECWGGCVPAPVWDYFHNELPEDLAAFPSTPLS